MLKARFVAGRRPAVLVTRQKCWILRNINSGPGT